MKIYRIAEDELLVTNEETGRWWIQWNGMVFELDAEQGFNMLAEYGLVEDPWWDA